MPAPWRVIGAGAQSSLVLAGLAALRSWDRLVICDLDATRACVRRGPRERGTIPGRTTDAETTIYTPVGLPWQDLALAWTAYRLARESGTGRHFDFLT